MTPRAAVARYLAMTPGQREEIIAVWRAHRPDRTGHCRTCRRDDGQPAVAPCRTALRLTALRSLAGHVAAGHALPTQAPPDGPPHPLDIDRGAPPWLPMS